MPINVIKDKTITNTGVPAVIDNAWSELLPSGYTALEYIEGDGTQYIDTGFKANNNTSVEVDFAWKTPPSNKGVAVLFGTSSSWSDASYGFYKYSTWYSNHKTDTPLASLDIPEGVKTKVYKNKNLCYVNDSLVHTHAEATFQATNNLLLGKIAISNQYGSYAKYYDCKIWDNDILIRNFIPAKNSSDVVGMFDLVTGTFYTNTGTGVFAAGPAINTYTIKGNTVQTNNLLPVEYKAIDFIESHGTEYIDTGVIPNNETGIFTQLSIPNTSAETHPIGVRESDKRFSIDTTSTSQVCFGFGGYIQPQTDWNIANNEIFTASLNYLNNRKAKANNGTELTLGTMSTALTNTIPLFARNYSTITGYACKIYQCKISQGSMLIRDMIPAKRLTDNVLGMYDKVEGKFYTNAGTGSFSGAEEMSINLFDMKYDVGYTGSYPNITTVAGGQSTEWIETSKFGQYFYFIWNIKEKLSNCVLGLVYSNNKSEILYRDGLVNASVVPAVNTDYVGGGGNPYKINSSYTYVKFYFLNWANVNRIGIYTTLQNTFIPYGQIPADTDNTCDIPSPTHPVELHSVGDKTEQLIDSNNVTNGYYYADSGVYTVSANARLTDWVKANANEAYTFKCTRTGTPMLRMCFFNENKEYISQQNTNASETLTATSPANTKYIRFSANYQSVNRIDWDTAMLVEGTTAPTSYVPYGYNLPLFHRSDCGVVDLGTLTWNKLTTYDTIRFVSSPYHDAKPTADNSTVGNIYMEGMTTYSTNGLIASTNDGVAISSTSMIAFRITAYNNMTADQFKQTISGKYLYYQRATDTSWTTPTLNNLYLSEPLRKVGNYSDYIDYENQQVVRNVGVKVLDGTENWQSYTYQTNPLSFYLIFSDMIDTTASTSSDNFYNTHLTFVPTVWGNSDIGFACSTLKRMFMRRNITDTTETWKSWLATQYANGNPVIIYYPLATPTYEAITLPELPVELHNKLNLYNVETKLAPSEINVTYRGNMTEGHNITYNNKYYPIKYDGKDY